MTILRGQIPATPAQPPRVGLLASARVLDTEDRSRWETGFDYQPEGCAVGGISDPCNIGVRSIPPNPDIVSGDPFDVWAGDSCSAFGFAGRQDRISRATRQLLATQSYQVAREFWRGDLTRAADWDANYLTRTPMDSVGGGVALDPGDALECLEEQLGKNALGQRGMIHATQQLVSRWSRLNMIRFEGVYRLTANDTIVVGDAGYDGSGPDNTPTAIAPAIPVPAAGGTLDDGEHSYIFVVRNTTTGQTSAPVESAAAVAGAGNNTMNLVDFDVVPAGHEVLVYRKAPGDDTGYLIDTVAAGLNDYTDDGSQVQDLDEPAPAGPSGPTVVAGSQWAYATTLVTVRLGPITVSPPDDDDALVRATNRDLNTIEVIASRPAAATFDGCAHIGVEVDLAYCAED